MARILPYHVVGAAGLSTDFWSELRGLVPAHSACHALICSIRSPNPLAGMLDTHKNTALVWFCGMLPSCIPSALVLICRSHRRVHATSGCSDSTSKEATMFGG